MAHNIHKSRIRKTDSFASTKPAWHGLGQIVNKAMTVEQAMRLANLDFNVELRPVYIKMGKQEVRIDNKFATVRTDEGTPLGVVGQRYNVIQNVDAFTFFDYVKQEEKAIFETAGALGKGERVFITAKMPETIEIRGLKLPNGQKDITEVYVLLTLAHDGSSAIKVVVTPVRVVCNNTLTAALNKNYKSISIRHTASATGKLDEARQLLGIYKKEIQNMNTNFNVLSSKFVKDSVVKELIEQVFKSQVEDSTRAQNIRDGVFNSYKNGVGQKGIIGTAWGALNGISYYLNHDKKYSSTEKLFDSLTAGTSANIMKEASSLLLAM